MLLSTCWMIEEFQTLLDKGGFQICFIELGISGLLWAWKKSWCDRSNGFCIFFISIFYRKEKGLWKFQCFSLVCWPFFSSYNLKKYFFATSICLWMLFLPQARGPARESAIHTLYCEAFMYIVLLHSNATSLATLHQSSLVYVCHMYAIMLACVARKICIAIEQSCYSTSNTALCINLPLMEHLLMLGMLLSERKNIWTAWKLDKNILQFMKYEIKKIKIS